METGCQIAWERLISNALSALEMVWKLNEEHVITRCPALDYERKSLGVVQYLDLRSQTQPASFSRQFKDYLGGDNDPALTMARRAGIIRTMLATWLGYTALGPWPEGRVIQMII